MKVPPATCDPHFNWKVCKGYELQDEDAKGPLFTLKLLSLEKSASLKGPKLKGQGFYDDSWQVDLKVREKKLWISFTSCQNVFFTSSWFVLEAQNGERKFKKSRDCHFDERKRGRVRGGSKNGQSKTGGRGKSEEIHFKVIKLLRSAIQVFFKSQDCTWLSLSLCWARG